MIDILEATEVNVVYILIIVVTYFSIFYITGKIIYYIINF